MKLDEAVELLPCPFCASKAIIADDAYGNKWCICDDCGACTSECETKNEAVSKWNHRALLAQLKAAPQPSTAHEMTAPSQEGVGQGEVASAAPQDDPTFDMQAAGAPLRAAPASVEGMLEEKIKEISRNWANRIDQIARQRHSINDYELEIRYAIKEALSLREQREGMVETTRTFDARTWAKSFNETLVKLGYQPHDEGWLLGWFANAIMCGHDHALSLREQREGIVSAAIEFESYLARVNTLERQSIVFQVPNDDTDGLALAGFCERLTRLSKAIRAAAPSAGRGEGKK